VAETDGVDEIIDHWRREIEARLEPVYREHGLEHGWHDVLATLRRGGPPYELRASEFTKGLMITSSGATKRLDRLERAGLIARRPDPADRRGILIALTDEGRRMIDAVTAPHLANEARLLEALSAKEREQLAGLLRKLQLGLPED
jgi:DNA-binding MarR family transcriptional regulator